MIGIIFKNFIMNDINDIPNQVFESICSVVGRKPIGLHEPKFSGNEWKYLKDCLDSTFVSSIGKYVENLKDFGRIYWSKICCCNS